MPTTLLDTFTKQVMRRTTPYFPHQLAFMLDSPVHRALANPPRVAERLDLSGSEQVLELGPGPGLFSVEIARRLTNGRLEQFDLQPEMLTRPGASSKERVVATSDFTPARQARDFPSATTLLTGRSCPRSS